MLLLPWDKPLLRDYIFSLFPGVLIKHIQGKETLICRECRTRVAQVTSASSLEAQLSFMEVKAADLQFLSPL